jgi:predicted Zn-ribbon and HTH transcriptional regulator
MVEKIAEETIRQQIISRLGSGPMNAIEISQDVAIMEKEVYGHLNHIARSMAAQGKRLVIHPSRCLKCGFIFEKRERFTRPGRCPQCRATRIKRPEYEILENT